MIETTPRHRFARLRTPVVGLFVLAPLVGEYLLGDLPIVLLPAIVLLAPMYGGGALLIREVARRRGLRWPGILLLALAYGVFEEGVVTQSLFDPDYVGEHLLRPAHVAWLGTGLVWAFFVVSLHVLGSIGAPIALVEALTPERRYEPWLGRRGLIVTAVVFVVGCVLNFVFTLSTQDFVAPWYRFAEALVVVVVLVACALLVPGRPGPAGAAAAPGYVVVGVVVFVLASVYLSAPWVVDALTPWGTVAMQVLVVAVATGLLLVWSRRPGWSARHVLAVAAAVLGVYVWRGYQHVGLSLEGAVFLVGNLLLDALVLRLVVLAFRRTPAEEV
ncbi:hypothetical protein [Cryptosporangium phraense]|uniref:hypothetical protein n=1 Tax=Cryptosporangium phraense TaxID=2593070 RepID=UPI001478C839|nr:hypothetical protein [Cryptosporangium phraense]